MRRKVIPFYSYHSKLTETVTSYSYHSRLIGNVIASYNYVSDNMTIADNVQRHYILK
jgi:hypothetical protein